MADRIAVMNNGVLSQVDAPLNVYRQPVDTFVARFLGEPAINLLYGDVWPRGSASVIQLDGGGEILIDGALPAHGPMVLGVRPHLVGISTYPSRFANPVRVESVEYQGAEEIVTLSISGTEVRAIAPAGFARPNGIVAATIHARDVLIFDQESGLAFHRLLERRAA